MMFHYENNNGDETFKVNGKEVSKEEYYKHYNQNLKENDFNDSFSNSISNLFSDNLFDKFKLDGEANVPKNTQSDFDYYTKNTFNIFEAMHFLEKHPDWMAKDQDNIKYYVDRNGFLINKTINRKESITNNLLNSKFKLIPPKKDRNVSFLEAIQELHNNYKTIYCIYNGEKFIFDKYELMADEESGLAINTDMIFNGEWYVVEV